jgi:carboxyl-terminal processing protease
MDADRARSPSSAPRVGSCASMTLAPVLVLVLAGCAATPTHDATPAPTGAAGVAVEPGLRWQDAKLLAEAIARLRSDYVDEVSSRALTIEALKGMLAGLDAYSTYLTPEEYAALGEYTDGAMPDYTEGPPAGTIPGAAPSAMPTVPPGGTPPPAPPPSDPRPIGARVATPSVIASAPRPGLARLQVTRFTVSTAAELEHELVRLGALGPLRGAVLDLRGNPGGVFGAGAAVADLFVESGVLLRAEGRAPDSNVVREATPGDLLAGAPLLVLIDGATASAAEIAAGALQDRGRALVMGSRSYGKGSVQSVIPLRSGGAVKFTTARYLLPSGRAIDGVGIEPDLPLAALSGPAADHPDPALEHALDALAAAARSR